MVQERSVTACATRTHSIVRFTLSLILCWKVCEDTLCLHLWHCYLHLFATWSADILATFGNGHNKFLFYADMYQVISGLSSALPMYQSLSSLLRQHRSPDGAACHLSAIELSRLLHLVCRTICLAKLHLLSHCIHSGDISKHSCFSDLFRTSSWHSSGFSNSSFLLRTL